MLKHGKCLYSPKKGKYKFVDNDESIHETSKISSQAKVLPIQKDKQRHNSRKQFYSFCEASEKIFLKFQAEGCGKNNITTKKADLANQKLDYVHAVFYLYKLLFCGELSFHVPVAKTKLEAALTKGKLSIQQKIIQKSQVKYKSVSTMKQQYDDFIQSINSDILSMKTDTLLLEENSSHLAFQKHFTRNYSHEFYDICKYGKVYHYENLVLFSLDKGIPIFNHNLDISDFDKKNVKCKTKSTSDDNKYFTLLMHEGDFFCYQTDNLLESCVQAPTSKHFIYYAFPIYNALCLHKKNLFNHLFVLFLTCHGIIKIPSEDIFKRTFISQFLYFQRDILSLIINSAHETISSKVFFKISDFESLLLSLNRNVFREYFVKPHHPFLVSLKNINTVIFKQKAKKCKDGWEKIKSINTECKIFDESELLRINVILEWCSGVDAKMIYANYRSRILKSKGGEYASSETFMDAFYKSQANNLIRKIQKNVELSGQFDIPSLSPPKKWKKLKSS